MAVLTLTSDFGPIDYQVPAIKAAVLSARPETTIADISHAIQPYDLKQTAYLVHNAYRYFPVGSVHMIAVDSQYHPQKRNLVCRVNGHYFIAPDNGLFSIIHPDIKVEALTEITYKSRFDDIVTFTALDIFVPAAVHLLNGGVPNVIGREVTEHKQLSFPKAAITDKFIAGEVVYIDNFGNAVTNISENKFDEVARVHEKFTIRFRNMSFSKIVKTTADFIPKYENENLFHGKQIAMFNAAGLLQIMIYKGNHRNGANTLLGLAVGTKIYIEFGAN